MRYEIIIGSVSVCVTLLIAALSYLQAKRLKFFDTFFQRKEDAFENYIKAISYIPKTEDELYQLSAISRTAILYSFEDNKKKIEELLDLMIKAYQLRSKDEMPESIQANFRTLRGMVINSLRNEIQVCRKFRFN